MAKTKGLIEELEVQLRDGLMELPLRQKLLLLPEARVMDIAGNFLKTASHAQRAHFIEICADAAQDQLALGRDLKAGYQKMRRGSLNPVSPKDTKKIQRKLKGLKPGSLARKVAFSYLVDEFGKYTPQQISSVSTAPTRRVKIKKTIARNRRLEKKK